MSSPDPTPSRGAASLARGVTATGWYIATSMAFFLVGTLFVWGVVVLFARGGWRAPVTLIGFPLLSAIVVAATVVLLVRYRRDGDLDDADRPRRFLSVPVIAGVVSSMILGAVAESALLGASLVGATLCVVRWGPGIRWRGVVLLEAGLVVLWFLELARPAPGSDAFLLAFFAIMLPATQALSLWSWDVVLQLDSARRTEARLAAVTCTTCRDTICRSSPCSSSWPSG